MIEPIDTLRSDIAVLRKWTATIKSSDETAFAAYVVRTGVADLSSAPGCRTHQIMARAREKGVVEISVLS